MKNLLLLAIFILGFLSCNTIKRVAAGYKDKISTNDIIIRDQFEKKYPNVDVIFYTDSAMQLLDILTFFSQEDADKSFKLPLPIVYDNLNGAYLNTIPAPGACFGGFDDNLKNMNALGRLDNVPDALQKFTEKTMNNNGINIDKKYVFFIFWTQKTYRANKTQMRDWMKIAKIHQDIQIIAVNVDLCLFNG